MKPVDQLAQDQWMIKTALVKRAIPGTGCIEHDQSHSLPASGIWLDRLTRIIASIRAGPRAGHFLISWVHTPARLQGASDAAQRDPSTASCPPMAARVRPDRSGSRDGTGSAARHRLIVISRTGQALGVIQVRASRRASQAREEARVPWRQ